MISSVLIALANAQISYAEFLRPMNLIVWEGSTIEWFDSLSVPGVDPQPPAEAGSVGDVVRLRLREVGGRERSGGGGGGEPACPEPCSGCEGKEP